MTPAWLRGGRTLHGRLVVGLLALLVVGLAAMGFASSALLEASLINRIDDRLEGMSRPWERGHHPPIPPPDSEPRRGLPTDFRVQFFDEAGRPVSEVIGDSEAEPGYPLISPGVLSNGTVSVRDSSGGADWRVRTVPLSDGRLVALALSTHNAQATVRELVLIEVMVGGAVVVAVAVLATLNVRMGLRPLTRIEHTAHAIATGDLERRVPDQDPRTETGRLGVALNTMLGRLVTALHEREQSEQRLRRFVADASHELRTPLTSIRGFAELYRRSDEHPEADVRRMMSRIESEALRMGELVDDLLLLARLDREAGVELAGLDLVPLVDDALHDARVRAPDREITVCAETDVLRVLGNSGHVRQVLTNLLSNALIHTEAGSPVRVWLGCGGVDEAAVASAGAPVSSGVMGVVEVIDRGPGVSAEHAPRLFDRFYRVADGRERSEGGSGLGLAITSAIMDAHHGRVELRRSGAGSAFRVLFPLA